MSGSKHTAFFRLPRLIGISVAQATIGILLLTGIDCGLELSIDFKFQPRKISWCFRSLKE